MIQIPIFLKPHSYRQRKIKLNISQELGRVGFMVDKGFELNILGENKPELKYLKEIIHDKTSSFAKFDQYRIPDYFIPANMLLGIVSAEEYQKKGVGRFC